VLQPTLLIRNVILVAQNVSVLHNWYHISDIAVLDARCRHIVRFYINICLNRSIGAHLAFVADITISLYVRQSLKIISTSVFACFCQNRIHLQDTISHAEHRSWLQVQQLTANLRTSGLVFRVSFWQLGNAWAIFGQLPTTETHISTSGLTFGPRLQFSMHGW